MTNKEKYKNEDERRRAFDLYCSNMTESLCENYNYICKDCLISWLELEDEDIDKRNWLGLEEVEQNDSSRTY